MTTITSKIREYTILDYRTPVMIALTKLIVFAGARAHRAVLHSGFLFGNHVDVVCGKVWGSLGYSTTNVYLPVPIKRRLVHALLMS
uniref:Uncharacterized protein n=1 Tax=Glossina palpalis gambiensis TaxID=67801 RepID=A0A1B0BDR7_9MUSC